MTGIKFAGNEVREETVEGMAPELFDWSRGRHWVLGDVWGQLDTWTRISPVAEVGIAAVLSKVDGEAIVHTWGMAAVADCRLGGRITWTDADIPPEAHCSRISLRIAFAVASMFICEIWTLIGMVFCCWLRWEIIWIGISDGVCWGWCELNVGVKGELIMLTGSWCWPKTWFGKIWAVWVPSCVVGILKNGKDMFEINCSAAEVCRNWGATIVLCWGWLFSKKPLTTLWALVLTPGLVTDDGRTWETFVWDVVAIVDRGVLIVFTGRQRGVWDILSVICSCWVPRWSKLCWGRLIVCVSILFDTEGLIILFCEMMIALLSFGSVDMEMIFGLFWAIFIRLWIFSVDCDGHEVLLGTMVPILTGWFKLDKIPFGWDKPLNKGWFWLGICVLLTLLIFKRDCWNGRLSLLVFRFDAGGTEEMDEYNVEEFSVDFDTVSQVETAGMVVARHCSLLVSPEFWVCCDGVWHVVPGVPLLKLCWFREPTGFCNWSTAIAVLCSAFSMSRCWRMWLRSESCLTKDASHCWQLYVFLQFGFMHTCPPLILSILEDAAAGTLVHVTTSVTTATFSAGSVFLRDAVFFFCRSLSVCFFFMCVFTLLLCLEVYVQKSQRNGLSSLWVRKWLCKALLREHW